MSQLGERSVEFKIAPPESLSIIGSNSINTRGDLYVIEINSIVKVNNLRNKRLFDFGTALLLLPLSPLLMWAMKNPPGFILNLIRVLTGFRTWIGYGPAPAASSTLPHIRKGVLNPTDALSVSNLDTETILRLNMLYARDYKITNDINIFVRGFRSLGRKG